MLRKNCMIFLLVFSLILCLCPCAVSAAGGSIELDATKYAYLTPGIPVYDDCVQLRSGQVLGFDVDLGENKIDSIDVILRTGTVEAGKIEVKIDEQSGESIAEGDAAIFGAGADWVSKLTLSMSAKKRVTGRHMIYISNSSGVHSIHFIVVHLKDANAIEKTFASIELSDRFSDIEDDVNRERINLLAGIGVVPTDKAFFLPSKPVLRGEFASMIANAIEAKKYASGNMPFYDMTLDEPNASEICGLYNLGIIKGDTDGNFRPNSLIKLNEIASLCVNALGYQPFLSGSKGAMEIANSIKIFKGIDTSDEYITKSEAVRIIFNLMTSDYLMPKQVESNLVFYESEKNFIEKNSKYVYEKGVVSANYDTELYRPRNNAKTIRIGETDFAAGTTNAADYIGCLCEYFYYEKDGEKILAAIYPDPAVKIDVIKSQPDFALKKFTERELIYISDDDAEDTELEFDAKTAFIYNGIALDRSLDTLIMPSDFTGTITLIDNNKDDVYDCVWIDKARNIVVSGVSNGKIYDKLTNTVLDGNGENMSVFVNGMESSLTAISNDDVLTVFESANKSGKKLIRILGDQNIISGSVTSMSKDCAVLDGTEYKISNDCTDDIYPGLAADFYLNGYNEIVRYSALLTKASKLGLYMGVSTGGSTLNADVKIKLLTEKDGIITIEAADRITVDGVVIKNKENLYDGTGLFKGMKNVSERTPILYETDDSGKLIMIDTYLSGTNGEDDSLTKLYDTRSVIPLGSVLVDDSWLHYQPFKSDVKVIRITSDNDENNFSIVTGLYNDNDRRFNATPYAMKKDSLIADIVVSEGFSLSVDQNGEPFIFDTIKEELNGIGDKALFIYGYGAQKQVSYEVDADSYSKKADFRKTVESLKQGDLVMPVFTNSKLVNAKLCFIPGGAEENNNGVSTVLNNNNYVYEDASMAVAYGTVVAIENGFIKIVRSNEDDFMFFALSGSVATCEKKQYNGYKVIGAQNLGAVFEGDKIVVCISNHYIKAAFVYRDAV